MRRPTFRVWGTTLLFALAYAGCWLNSVENQARKLGQREFTPAAWSSATQMQRAEMTASFLEQYDTRGFTRKDIEALLGEQTAYYNYDSNLAYVVGPDTVQSMYGKGYLLVFEGDKDDGRIESVFFVPAVE